MPGLIIDGNEYPIPGLSDIVSYFDHPELKLRAPEDMRARRGRRVQSIVLHNTKAKETHIMPGRGPDTDLEHRITNWWSKDGSHAGAHLCVDYDLTVGCMADLLQDAAYHASSMNELSIGIEIFEDSSGKVYADQLQVVVELVEWLCRFFGIQRQMVLAGFDGEVPRIVQGGRTFYGVCGHCHQYSGKKHDPGRSIFQALRDAGFMEFNFAGGEGGFDDDRVFWSEIQKSLGLQQDGLPGPMTTDALRYKGYEDGLWRKPEAGQD